MAENHAIHLGKLLGNLQSLEALLRGYLRNIEAKHAPNLGQKLYWSLNVGDVVPEDAFTNYDTLGALISRFNADISRRDKSLTIDPSVVETRDLLAHGRVAADNPDPALLRIVKFDRLRDGKVAVVASALMSEAWFAERNTLVLAQMENIYSAINAYAH